MNNKIRVSIVATSLKGSNITPEPRPILNVVSGSQGRGSNFSDNLFYKNNVEQNIVNSIDGATALKLDESYEIKNSEEQNNLIDSFESSEENYIAQNAMANAQSEEAVPSGVSIESASYIENNTNLNINVSSTEENNQAENNTEEEYTPKLFLEEQSNKNEESFSLDETKDSASDELLDQDINEDEDFEIPAFLRRQKF